MKLKALQNGNNSVSNAQTGFPICNAFSNHIIFLSLGGGGGGGGKKKSQASTTDLNTNQLSLYVFVLSVFFGGWVLIKKNIKKLTKTFYSLAFIHGTVFKDVG